MSDYRLVVAVANPASVEPLTRMGCGLARANEGALTITSVAEVPDQIPAPARDDLASQQEAIVERALSVADSLGVSADGHPLTSHEPTRSVVSLVEQTDAAGLLVGASDLVPFKESLLGRTFLERVIEQVPCEVYVEQIGPGRAVPGDSVLVPVAEGEHTDAVLEVASDVGRAYDMQVHLVTVLSPPVDVQRLERTEDRLRTALPDDAESRGTVTATPGSSVVETLVELTGEHDLTVLGATADSTLSQFLSGTVPTGLAKRSRNPLLLVNRQ